MPKSVLGKVKRPWWRDIEKIKEGNEERESIEKFKKESLAAIAKERWGLEQVKQNALRAIAEERAVLERVKADSLGYINEERKGLLQIKGPRRQRVFAYIVAYKRDNDGCSPTLTDIKNGCHLPDRMAAAREIRELIKLGWVSNRLELKTNRRYSSLRVTGGTWTVPDIEGIVYWIGDEEEARETET